MALFPASATLSRTIPGPAKRGRGQPDPGSVPLLVLEGELKLRPVGNRPAVFQVNVLLHDLSYAKITERPGRSPDRLRGRVFPRLAACPDDLGHPVDAHNSPPCI